MSKAAGLHEEEILGKAYDARLMRRLLGYVVPYRWTAAVAIALIILSSLLQLVGPLATAVALDLFIRPFAGEVETLSTVSRWVAEEMVRRGLEVEPAVGLGIVSLIYLGSLLLTFLVLYWQGYIMQLMGQMIMFVAASAAAFPAWQTSIRPSMLSATAYVRKGALLIVR